MPIMIVESTKNDEVQVFYIYVFLGTNKSAPNAKPEEENGKP